MKKLIILLSIMVLCMPIETKAVATNSSYDNIKVYLFYGDDCKDCDKAKDWLENELKNHDRVRSALINIENDDKLYKDVKKVLDIKKDNEPVLILGSNYFVGYNDKTKNNLTEAIKAYEDAKDYCDIVSKIQNDEDTNSCLEQNKDIYEVKEVPIALVIGISAGVLVIAIALCTFIIIKKKRKKADKK